MTSQPNSFFEGKFSDSFFPGNIKSLVMEKYDTILVINQKFQHFSYYPEGDEYDATIPIKTFSK